MAADAVNIAEDSEITECDGDKVVTMMDVLQEQQDFEEDANAVLGASDDKNCTFAKGYIKRQALYACLTCCPDVKTDPMKRAGVCLACSLNCHENHELVELYTKRNFRCDCGNPKFNSHPCQFTPNKPDLNSDNIYNHNFSGIYCICQRPYPDPEASFEDDMIQCIICEDWLHASHLDTTVPANDQYSEMICKGCMEKNEFLHDYSNLAVNVESVDVDIITVNGDKSSDTVCNGKVVEDVMKKDVVENKIIQNGHDAEMSEDKSETSQQKEETPTKDITSNENNDNTMEIDSVTDQETQSRDARETNEDDEKSNETEEKEVKKNDQNLEQGNSVDGLIESSDSANNTAVEKSAVPNSKTQEEEKATNNMETDIDISDENKTEDQLLDDIRALTSDNIVDAEPTPISKEQTEISKPGDQLIKSSEIGNDSSNDQNIDHSEESMLNQSNEKSVITDNNNPVSEPTNDTVSNISENKCTTLENTDQKADAVMDAIDEILKKPADTDSDCKDTQKADDKPTTTENIERQEGTDIGINQDDSRPVKTDSTDTDMTENKTQKESQLETTLADSESTNTDITINTDAEKLELTENIDSNGESEALNETNNEPKHDSGSRNQSIDENNSTGENKRKLSTEEDEKENSPKKAKLDKDHCSRPRDVKKVYKGATFWPSNFRQKLCTCGECISMYKDLHVLFLTDPDDTVSAYESLGKENVDTGASQYEKGLQALSSLDRIQQINALTEYNKMRDKLLDFLKGFKDRKVIVKEEDIKAFFAGMKPRREPDGVYFCR